MLCVVVMLQVVYALLQVVCVVVLRAVVSRRGNHDNISNPGDWYHGNHGPQAQQKKDEPSTTCVVGHCSPYWSTDGCAGVTHTLADE